ncbi:MAG: hypothetical protein ACRDL1_09620 [Solirubrobacterales bacterium]
MTEERPRWAAGHRFHQTTLPDNTPFKSVVAKCQSGEKIIGGGANALVSGESV